MFVGSRCAVHAYRSGGRRNRSRADRGRGRCDGEAGASSRDLLGREGGDEGRELGASTLLDDSTLGRQGGTGGIVDVRRCRRRDCGGRGD